MIQGPLVEADDFTAESAAYYRRYSPESVVIVSTWNDAPSDALARCEAAGAVIVQSKPPSVSGAMNVNFQCVSTHAGLRKAREIGCEYALKTRTDSRIYAPNAPEFLLDLLRTFPVRHAQGARMRLISTSVVTARFCPYFLSDQLQFGHIDDMLRYWSPAPNTRQGPRATLTEPLNRIDGDDVPEIYLTRSYCERIGRAVEPSIRSWWEALADCFLVVDRDMLDVYWPKYAPHVERPSLSYEKDPVWANLYFRDWLRLYREFGPNSETPEHLLELPGQAWPGFDERRTATSTDSR